MMTLCSITDIPDPGSKGIQVTHSGNELNIFIIHVDGNFHGYINRCPHTGINLEWLPDQFLNNEQTFIQCSTHGALFDIEPGRCIHGPCLGEQLSPINIHVHNQHLIADF